MERSKKERKRGKSKQPQEGNIEGGNGHFVKSSKLKKNEDQKYMACLASRRPMMLTAGNSLFH